MIEKQKHVHKFKRITYKSGNSTFFCTLPDCPVKIAIPLALGKRCICWRCGNEFILNEYALRLAKPHCESCHKPKKGIETFKIVGVTKDGTEIPINPSTMTLAERLQQEVNQRQTVEEEEI